MSNNLNIKKEAKKGVKWTSIASMFSALCQLGLLVLLARYLDSEDFGLMAIALFVINLSQMFIDMGVSNAIIHKQDISKKELDSLYWLNIFMGIGVFIILYFLSGIIASFYNEEKLRNVLIVISLSFLIQPIGAQFSVLLRKYLMFKEIAIRSIISQIFGFVVGVIGALAGWGVYALVASNLIITIVSTITLLIIGLRFHRPSLYFKMDNVKPFLSFGLFQMGEKIVNFLNHEADVLIVGKVLDVSTLGVYNIAKNFIIKPYQVFNPILTKIGFPLMAKLQHDPLGLKRVYKSMMEVLSYVNFPIFIYIAFFPQDVVELVFGPEWRDAIEPLRILSIYALFRSTMNPIGSLQLAKGRADLGFYWNLVQFMFLPITIYIGSFWGIIGVCVSLMSFQFLSFSSIGTIMLKRLSGMKEREYYSIFIFPLLLSLIISFSVSFIHFQDGFIGSGIARLLLYGTLIVVSIALTRKEMIKKYIFSKKTVQ